MIITPTTLKTRGTFTAIVTYSIKPDEHYSVRRHFGPSDATVDVLITDGAKMSDSAWSCAWDASLLSARPYLTQFGSCNTTSDGTRFLTGERYTVCTSKRFTFAPFSVSEE